MNFAFAKNFIDFSSSESNVNYINYFVTEEMNSNISYDEFSDFIFPLANYNKKDLADIINKINLETKPKWEYVVKKGDTLSSISKKFKIKVNELFAVNNLNEKSVIRVGDKIFIPGVKPRVIIEEQNIVRQLAGKFVSALKDVGELVIPVSGFNWGHKHGNNATDIAAPCGEPVYAANNGIVIESRDGWNSGYGNYIIIDHNNGTYTLYGHLSLRIVDIGKKVVKGELIGYVGNTGYTIGETGCHLHFEVRGKSNPLLK